MKSIFAVVIGALLGTNAMAAGLDGKTLYKEKTCVACHGPDGKKPLLPEYPKVAGQNKDYMVRQMVDIKENKRTNGNSASMAGVMHLVSVEEIGAIADYLSKVKP